MSQAPITPVDQPTLTGPPFDMVLFDCDSTLSAIEGFDELARRADNYAAIAQLTTAAMDGQLSLEQVYQSRLQQLQPTRADIDWLAERYIEALVPAAAGTVSRLHRLGKEVHIVSGGLYQALLPLAERLGIPSDKVHAVAIDWDAQGRYRGFDEASPLARAKGKAIVCATLRTRDQRMVLIGDGSTDLEAAAAGVYVIGYGGVVQRPLTLAQARVFVPGPALSEVLPYVLTQQELLVPD